MNTPELKQSSDLTSSDFERHPVWAAVHSFYNDEPWFDDTDEETFWPWSGEFPVSPDLGIFLVRAEFETANGTRLVGFVTPSTTTDLGELQPTILIGSDQIGLWHGVPGSSAEEREYVYEKLGLSAEQLFPLRFGTGDALATRITSSQADGFYSLDENGTVQVER